MKRACIAIVDAARARLFTPQAVTAERLSAAARARETMREEIALVNPHRRAPVPAYPPPLASAIDREFAHHVVSEIDRVVRAHDLDHVLMFTTPNLLSELRLLDGVLHRPELTVEYVERDLARLTSPPIHDHLAGLPLVALRGHVATASR